MPSLEEFMAAAGPGWIKIEAGTPVEVQVVEFVGTRIEKSMTPGGEDKEGVIWKFMTEDGVLWKYSSTSERFKTAMREWVVNGGVYGDWIKITRTGAAMKTQYTVEAIPAKSIAAGVFSEDEA